MIKLTPRDFKICWSRLANTPEKVYPQLCTCTGSRITLATCAGQFIKASSTKSRVFESSSVLWSRFSSKGYFYSGTGRIGQLFRGMVSVSSWFREVVLSTAISTLWTEPSKLKTENSGDHWLLFQLLDFRPASETMAGSGLFCAWKSMKTSMMVVSTVQLSHMVANTKLSSFSLICSRESLTKSWMSSGGKKPKC